MGRVRRAWRKGVREEPAFYVLQSGAPAQTWRIRAGRSAYRCPRGRRELPGGIAKPYREAMGKACGVLMAMLLGHSRAPNPLNGSQ